MAIKQKTKMTNQEPETENMEAVAEVDEVEIEQGEHEKEISSPFFKTVKQLGTTVVHATVGAVITIEHRTAKWFNRLVEKGARYQYQSNTQDRAADELRASEKLKKKEKAERNPKPRAVDRIHNLETSIEHSLGKGRTNTLHWMGVSSRNDFTVLQQQVADLTQQVEELQSRLLEKKHEEKTAELPVTEAADHADKATGEN